MPGNMTSRDEFIKPISVIFGDEIVLPRTEEAVDGATHVLFLASYEDSHGQEVEIYFYAKDREDAEARIEAIKETLELGGEWGGHFTEEQSN